jgi:hypothetical protein
MDLPLLNHLQRYFGFTYRGVLFVSMVWTYDEPRIFSDMDNVSRWTHTESCEQYAALLFKKISGWFNMLPLYRVLMI